MIFFTFAFLLVAAVLAFLWLDKLVDLAAAERRIVNLQEHVAVLEDTVAALRSQLSASDEIRHSVANSALRGCPAVKWHRAEPVPPGADAWYWRAMFAGEPHLFTDEALREARQRAAHLLPAGRSVPLIGRLSPDTKSIEASATLRPLSSVLSSPSVPSVTRP